MKRILKGQLHIVKTDGYPEIGKLCVNMDGVYNIPLTDEDCLKSRQYFNNSIAIAYVKNKMTKMELIDKKILEDIVCKRTVEGDRIRVTKCEMINLKTKISIAEIVKFAPLSSRTITHYTTTGTLPKPLSLDGELYFERKDIMYMLGVKDLNMDEPLITTEEAAQITNYTTARLGQLANKNYIPNYKVRRMDGGFNNIKGSKYFFRKSELCLIAEWSTKFSNKAIRMKLMSDVLDHMVDNKLMESILSSDEILVIKGLLVDGMEIRDLATKMDLTRERVRQLMGQSVKKLIDGLGGLETNMYLKDQLVNYKNECTLLKEEIRAIKNNEVKIVADIIPNEDVLKMMSVNLERYSKLGELSVRAFNVLDKSDVFTIGDLIHMDPKKLFKSRNIGIKTYMEVLEFVNGLSLITTLPDNITKPWNEQLLKIKIKLYGGVAIV